MAAEGRSTGRTALVTGSGRGFGRAIALGFAREGADVAIAYRTSQAEAQATAVEVACVGRQVLLIRSDLAQARQARSLAEQVLVAFGRVDILVNNAGIMDVARFVDQDPAIWDAMLTIDISGPLHLTLHQRIINLSSQLAHVGGADFAVYSGTKGSILTVTTSLAREVGRFGVTVNTICPGSIVTAMNRHIYPPERQTKRAAELALRRMGDPADVAGAALKVIDRPYGPAATIADERGEESMICTVVGAGAIGGTVGAYMARAGDQIDFVDVAADHVAAMKERGLTIQAYNETFTVPVVAHHPEELTGPLDIVLLAVKSQHTEAAVQSIRPLLGPESAIVSLQNGLCESTIAKLVGPERTIGAFIDLFADYLEPGVIQYGGPGTVRVGELDGTISPRVEEIVRHVRHWGPVEATTNVQGYLWSKLGFANMLFATALADETMADVIARYPDLMVDLASEVYEVADQEGVRLEPFDNVEPHLYYPREQRDWQVIRNNLADLEAWLRGNRKVKSGVWRDLAVRKRKTEVDQQIGLAAEIGRRHGLPMALTRKLVSMIHELEEGLRPMQWANLDELEQMRSGATMAAGSSGHA